MSKKIFFFGSWNPKINSKPNYKGFCVEINTIKFGLVFHEEFSDRILKEHPKLYSEIDTIYNKWLNIFPFELPIFESLKDSFAHKGIPFRLVKESNEITLFNLNDLVKVLFEISNDFFQQINAETLYGSSMIYDIDKHKVKLILQAKKQRNKLQYPKKENDFSIMIDEWLKDEQETWEQLTPYFYKKPHQIEEDNANETPPPTKLSDIITHERSVQIVEKIKVQYKNIKGKRLKLLLIALQDLELIPKERIASMFHRLCEKEFDWEIASYTAMNDSVINEHSDLEDLTSMKGFLKRIMNDK